MSDTKTYIGSKIEGSIAELSFFYPKANALPRSLLSQFVTQIEELSSNPNVSTILIKTDSKGAFCAGAYIDELKAAKDIEETTEYFMGFARLLLAIKNSPAIFIAAVSGKVVGGGLGLVSAMDYAIALNSASVKLSELSLELGPHVIAPAIERRIGVAALSEMSLDTKWKSAKWCIEKGLYAVVSETREELEKETSELTTNLEAAGVTAVRSLKQTLWKNIDSWESLLPKLARRSGELALSSKSLHKN